MAVLPSQDRLMSAAPPPSPIPTAKGSRSAAIDDQILSQYLERSLQIPDLTLPESFSPESGHPRLPALIDIRSLVSGDEDSIHQLLGSAVEFGVFRLKGHGISSEELRQMMAEADQLFLIATDKKRLLSQHFPRRKGNQEEFVWFCTETPRSEVLREQIGPQRYRSLSQKMENVAGRLEKISKQLCHILLQSRGLARKQSLKRIQEEAPVLCLYRFSNGTPFDKNDKCSDGTKSSDSCDYALRFHVPVGDCEFRSGPLSFGVASDTIVITVGRKFEEWSKGEVKWAPGEMLLHPTIDGSPSYSLVFMSSPSTSYYNKVISLADQIIIALIVAFLYSLF